MENTLQTTSNVIHIILGVILAIEKVNKFTFEINQPICEMQLAVIEQNNIALSKQIAKRKQNRQIIRLLICFLVALVVWFAYSQYKKLQVS